MKPTIAIQDVLVPHREVMRDLEACSRADIKPITFGLIPFSDEITGDFDRTTPAIPFGSTKLVKLWLQDKTPSWWRVFYSPQNFDWCTWAKAIGKYALNGPTMGRVAILAAVQDLEWSTRVFVKPTSDLKAFAGMVVNAGETIRGQLDQMTQDSCLTGDQSILWAPWQEIICEFRCYMHGSDMIEASRYRTGDRADHKPANPAERSALERWTKTLASEFTPARFYAVDVAGMPDGSMKVVEYNCINCSGRYEIDRGALFKRMLA